MRTISVIIPAFNEQENIPQAIVAIPVDRLREAGFGVELLVIDNGSTDRTGHVARAHGAKVIVQSAPGALIDTYEPLTATVPAMPKVAPQAVRNGVDRTPAATSPTS